MPAVCPDTPLLEQLMLGRVPACEAERLEAHLETCTSCVKLLASLQAVDPLVTAMRETSQVQPVPETWLIEAVIPWLKRLRPKDTAVTLLPGPELGSEAAPSATAYDFLAPAEEPGE